VITRTGDNLAAGFRVDHARELVGRGTDAGARRGTGWRWLKFNLVGGLGIAVQLTVVLGLHRGFHLNYLLATALAVEAAVVHNFVWHERYTWADRVQPSWRRSLARLLRFNLAAGGVSIAGNLGLVKLMVGRGHWNYLIANSVAILLCSLLNFLITEEWVFEAEAKQEPGVRAAPPE
jgi:putative flippase GtrA